MQPPQRRCAIGFADTCPSLKPGPSGLIGDFEPRVHDDTDRGSHHWRNELLSGRAKTVAKIAQRAGVRSRYARRILRAAFLAPDIIEAILDGRLCHAVWRRSCWSNPPSKRVTY